MRLAELKQASTAPSSHLPFPGSMGVAKKIAATALTTATSLAWKRLSWQARAALTGGSLALGAYRRLRGVRETLTGGRGKAAGEGRRRLHAASGPMDLPPAASALLT